MWQYQFRRKLLWLLSVLLLAVTLCPAQVCPEHYNCFTILVGKKASVDGAVLFAHNEDDWGEQVVYVHKVPSLQHTSDEYYTLKNGGTLPQSSVTNAYLWLEIPNMNFGDAFLNEYGVAIASNACPSRRTQADLTAGGINYDLRRIVAERAKSAREGVKLAGRLIEQFGYNSSGRTYSIADPNEAYLLAVVFGRLWVAQRIPDDAVALIPNYYTIGAIDLSDTLQFLAAPELVNFAIAQGWYEPQSGQPFNFRLAYSAPEELTNIRNCARHWNAINYFASQPYDLPAPLPTYLRRRQKVSKDDLFAALRLHYEHTPLAKPGNPHQNEIMTVCSEANQYGFVAELRGWLPPAIGAVLWLAPRRPCTMPFFPIYVGIGQLPGQFALLNYAAAQRAHFQPASDLYTYKPELLYWQCWQFTRSIDDDWATQYPAIQKRRDLFQAKILEQHKVFEEQLLKKQSLKPAESTDQLARHLEAILKTFNQYLSR